MSFKPCKGCPERLLCIQEFYRDGSVDCRHMKQISKASKKLPESPPMSLVEASEVVIRHWDLYGERGFEAAITLLRRVLESTKR